ncbi:protein RCC2 [Trichonephila clavipes]|nr:protein RCC2 [Trichonephila clavipes]
MNPKKRKADDEDSSETKDSYKDKANESETADINASNCGSGNSTDQQKSDNGGSSEQPGTSDEKVSEDCKDAANQSSETREKKQIRLEGSKEAGVLLISGGTNWDLIGRKELPKNG